MTLIYKVETGFIIICVSADKTDKGRHTQHVYNLNTWAKTKFEL